MAVDDLDILRDQLPEIFQDRALPSGWEENWLIIPIDDPELGYSHTINVPDYEVAEDQASANLALNLASPVGFEPTSEMPDFGEGGSFPGAPQTQHQWKMVPPPDALAFYFPFHYFHPHWWGVYLVLEGVHDLAAYLRRRSKSRLEAYEAFVTARLFLYGHEAFHHTIEAFATRLEITHRVPLYREGFERLFTRVFGTDDCVEEALATAYGYQKVKQRAFRKPNDRRKREGALDALSKYIEECPPGYQRALEFIGKRQFLEQRSHFAEQNHNEALPAMPAKNSPLWLSFPHAFSGISRVTSRVNYLVHRDSSLATRLKLGLRYVRYRDVSERLRRLGGCKIVREGRGSHEMWETPKGHRFPIPRHPGDFGRGLLAKIIKQAGLNLSVSEFLEARV